MTPFLYIAWFASLCLGLFPLWYARRFYREVTSKRAISRSTRRVLLISPCKGVDHELKQHLSALTNQDHPNYEVVFVTATPDDPACPIIREVISASQVRAYLIHAGISDKRGQKVNNLLAAISAFGQNAEIFAFVDSDVRPCASWLSSLVSPLDNTAKSGATTGYRWFVSPKNLLETLRAAWNSIGGVYEVSKRLSAVWGGAMAIERETFLELKISEAWDRAVSDDMSLSAVLRQQKRPIFFVPECLVRASGPIQLGAFLEWSMRQVIILRATAPALFAVSLFSLCLYLVLEAISLIGLISGGGPLYLFGALLLLAEIGTGIWLQRATHHYAALHGCPDSLPWYFPLVVPVAYTLLAYEHLLALFRKTITWRGVTYRLEGAFEARIIG